MNKLHITINKLTLLWLWKFPSCGIVAVLLYDDAKRVSCSSDTRSQVGERVKTYPLLVNTVGSALIIPPSSEPDRMEEE